MVDGRFCDSAISVREATLELLGRYIASHPNVALRVDNRTEIEKQIHEWLLITSSRNAKCWPFSVPLLCWIFSQLGKVPLLTQDIEQINQDLPVHGKR
ncbi:uncharacterized protein LOC110896317 isoform X2 [Helianthus annuus]|uniref:uncharacterized protein LOC110896317 isoform X2 n=1 Tax=Helianthus annuus TaxID=4232 RepID=UPI00165312A0|nr:uncharacterized protein LOC110896317 isoform X2 [Helianthus annuus]